MDFVKGIQKALEEQKALDHWRMWMDSINPQKSKTKYNK